MNDTTSRTKRTILQTSREFQPHELFFSCTDLNGKVLGGNKVFCRIAAYTEEELLGKPHSIIRHPDMPRVVFRALWDFLESGKSIAAYVKNLAKDGRYYWVMALANPIPGGYISVRFKPTSPVFHQVISLYQELRSLEKKIEAEPGKTKEDAITASSALLTQRLGELGFDSYEKFMRFAFNLELDAKDALVREGGATQEGTLTGAYASVGAACSKIRVEISNIYDRKHEFELLKELVQKTREFSAEISDTVNRTALNVSVHAEQHGELARTISVLASWLQSGCRNLSKEVAQITGPVQDTLQALESSVFELGVAKLQLDMIDAYLVEISGQTGKDSRDHKKHMELLTQNTSKSFLASVNLISELAAKVSLLDLGFAQLRKEITGLGLVRVNGGVEACRLPDSQKIDDMFATVTVHIGDAKSQLQQLERQINKIQTILVHARKQNKNMQRYGRELVQAI